MMADHDKTVREARDNMERADQHKPLERWMQNYASPNTVIPDGQWCVVTKEKAGWKVALGVADSTEPYMTLLADAHAPAPPVMEIRPPKPEPVKPRFNVPKPRHVDSFDRIRAAMDAAFNETLLYGAGTTNTVATESSFTVESLMSAIRNLPPELRRRDRVRLPVYEPFDFTMSTRYDESADAYKIKTVWADPRWAVLSNMDLRKEVMRITGIDRISLPDLPDPPMPPAPEPSKRNQ